MRKIKQHTLQKLEYLKKYINAYLTATKRLSAKYYIDAFAGTGKCILGKQEIDGSPLISLKAEKGFNKYIFIEKSKNNFKALQYYIDRDVVKDRLRLVEFHEGDCNVLLKNYNYDPSPYVGYLVFLDPAGPELFWETVIYLSKIKKVDLLILYPYDMALVRMVNDYPEQLDKFYGIDNWIDIYRNRRSAADARKKLLEFYIRNLENLGFEFIDYKPIRQRPREGKLLYYLIFATHNPAGKRIISGVFGKELDGQKSFKF